MKEIKQKKISFWDLPTYEKPTFGEVLKFIALGFVAFMLFPLWVPILFCYGFGRIIIMELKS